MNNLKLTLTKNIFKKDYKWLDRDFKKGEQVCLFTGNTYNCIGDDGIPCYIDGKESFFELPAGILSIEYGNKTYTIFLIEKHQGCTILFAKHGPFIHMDLLTEIQNQKSGDIKHPEANILKTQIIESTITLSLVPLVEIKPLF